MPSSSVPMRSRLIFCPSAVRTCAGGGRALRPGLRRARRRRGAPATKAHQQHRGCWCPRAPSCPTPHLVAGGGLQDFRLQLKAEARRKAHRAQHAQRVWGGGQGGVGRGKQHGLFTPAGCIPLQRQRARALHRSPPPSPLPPASPPTVQEGLRRGQRRAQQPRPQVSEALAREVLHRAGVEVVEQRVDGEVSGGAVGRLQWWWRGGQGGGPGSRRLAACRLPRPSAARAAPRAPRAPRAPALRVLQRRAELHGGYAAALCIALAAQVDQVDPQVVDLHARRFQVLRLLRVGVDHRGLGRLAALRLQVLVHLWGVRGGGVGGCRGWRAHSSVRRHARCPRRERGRFRRRAPRPPPAPLHPRAIAQSRAAPPPKRQRRRAPFRRTRGRACCPAPRRCPSSPCPAACPAPSRPRSAAWCPCPRPWRPPAAGRRAAAPPASA
jgi:hypothetical protein